MEDFRGVEEKGGGDIWEGSEENGSERRGRDPEIYASAKSYTPSGRK